MSALDLATILLVLAAVFSFLNYRYLKLPTAIGVMLIALVLSLTLIALGHLGVPGIETFARDTVARVEFGEALLEGMLGILLFAGALHIKLDDLAAQRGVVLALATAGVATSALIVGGLTFVVFGWLGFATPFLYCLLFGALIAPTDPIAVQGIIRSAGAPKALETKITGESLFNDGVGVVVFVAILEVATGAVGTGGHDGGALAIVKLFGLEAVGGLMLGLGAGYVGYLLIKEVDNYQVEVMLSLGLVMGTYSLAGKLHTSGALAVVAAGLLIGNQGRALAMSDKTQEHLDAFWELLDEILNAVLFLLIGLEVLVMPVAGRHLVAALIAIPAVLLARFVSVAGVVVVFGRFRSFSPGAIRIMTWAGLRGGISVALALTIPHGPHRSLLVAVTYAVVIFSIVVQGLTVGTLVRRIGGGAPTTPV